MALYQGKYRIESARLPGFGYGGGWWYHVVACTREKVPHFGTVRNAIMGLSELGLIAHRHCEELEARRPNVRTETYMVMPNHVHLLIGIRSPDTDEDPAPVPQTFGPLEAGALPAVVNAFKAGVTRDARRAGHTDFAWQARYYDRVVRSEREFRAKRQYILDNPLNWAKDRLNPDI